jgi:hypothetical protein
MPKGLKILMKNVVKPSQDGAGKIQINEKLYFFSLLCSSNFSDFHVTPTQKSSNNTSHGPQQPHKLLWVGGKIVATNIIINSLHREIDKKEVKMTNGKSV